VLAYFSLLLLKGQRAGVRRARVPGHAGDGIIALAAHNVLRSLPLSVLGRQVYSERPYATHTRAAETISSEYRRSTTNRQCLDRWMTHMSPKLTRYATISSCPNAHARCSGVLRLAGASCQCARRIMLK